MQSMPALVILVGMYTPLDGIVLTYEETEINVGDYMQYLVELSNLHYTAYSTLTPNTIYVDAMDVETHVDADPESYSCDVFSFLYNIVKNGTNHLLPTGGEEGGHAYITKQIRDALNLTFDIPEVPDEPVEPAGLLGDADGDGDVNNIDALMVLQYFVGNLTSFPAEN